MISGRGLDKDAQASGVGPRQIVSSRQLALVVMPTEACNFRCAYCYESNTGGRMSRGTAEGLERWLTHRFPELEELTLNWYGGEPLLAVDLVEQLQRHILTLQGRHPDVEVHAAMTTNGYLLRPALLRKLVSLRVTTYQVSLDGPGEHHDRTRALAGGQGTFDRIWSNLIGARDLDEDFSIFVRVHVHRNNLEVMPDFLRALARSFAGDDRFPLILRPVSRLGGRGNECHEVLTAEEASGAVERFRTLARRLGLHLFEGEQLQSRCYAALPHMWLVRADGTLGKCPVALSHPANALGRLRDDGKVEVDAERLRPWLRGVFSGDPGELACPAIGLAR